MSFLETLVGSFVNVSLRVFSIDIEYYSSMSQDLSTMEREAEEKSKIEKAQALQLYKQKEKLDQAKKVVPLTFQN